MISTICSTSTDLFMATRCTRARVVSLALLSVGCLAFASASAQTVYRSVDSKGRVTFSDQPPSNASQVMPLGGTRDGASQNAGLPYALRMAASKYPVTLYTAADCAPCNEGRSLLRSRGVPFTEKTINTPEDTESLHRLSNASSLPLLTIGSQQLKGFAAAEWNQYLNMAGYPQTSQLPADYRNPDPTPLVVLQPPVPPTPAARAPSAPVPAVRMPPPPPPNPAGIQF